MYLSKDQLQHINTVTHEGKVVVFATDAKGEISYTVKQDGFEDSYLNTPVDQRTGWEVWQTLKFPNETSDLSVVKKEQAELTYQTDESRYLIKSGYATQALTAVAPVQVISALGHIYVFRQSTANTLLVDRFVLDGMTNKLNRKLEVRFKRSKQKHEFTKTMQRGSGGLVNVDTLDFRDANGHFFYEPTTELCLINHLHRGWFSVVLVPTIENDVHRWHIFAYNSQTQKVELTTIRASETGLFDVKDYTVFEESNDALVPRRIPGVIKRTLEMNGVTVTNGLSATKYDLQQAQQTQSGEEQLLKTATRLMLAIPTDQGTAAFSFAIAGDGTLAEIDETPDSTIVRSRQREVLLPLNTLDEIKGIADRTPPPQGVISGFAEGTDEEKIEDLVKLSTNGRASELANGDLVKITGTSDYQGLYQAVKVDEETFDIDVAADRGLGYWEKEDPEAGGLMFDGMITAYERTTDGKLRVTCPNHGLEKSDLVQIAGTKDYNDTYPVQKIDDTHFVIERKWATGEAINVKLVSQRRRGIVFDGATQPLPGFDPALPDFDPARSVFDPEYYLTKHKDVAAYYNNSPEGARTHWGQYGRWEGRQGSAFFDAKYYLSRYPEIADQCGNNNYEGAIQHWLDHGLQEGRRGSAEFDPTNDRMAHPNDYVSLPEMHHNFSGGITVEAWVWYDSFQPNSRIIDFGNGAGIDNILLANENSSGNLVFKVFRGGREQSITVASVFETGKWIHIAATIDGSGIASLYKNGEQIKSGNLWLPDTLKRTRNYIGKSNFEGDAYFKGKISDLRLWTTARTVEEIKNSMYLQLTSKEVGLVGYWRLGGISEDKVIDFSVNCNDGTVYGEPYISAATLNRKLAGGTTAVKYSNPELFAVSERATYEESFEFKVNSATPVDLAYLDNADGKNLGTKIFTLSYWGKTSRSAEEKKAISAVQNKFEDLGKGWYRASCYVTIPDEVSLLRSFEIAKVQGTWQSLEIRKHQIRLLSDTITEAKYTDTVTLATLVDDHAALAKKLKDLEAKEKQEGVLLKEKRELELKIAAYNAQDATRAEIRRLEGRIPSLVAEEKNLKDLLQSETDNPFNYFCYVSVAVNSNSWKNIRIEDQGEVRLVRHRYGQPLKFSFVETKEILSPIFWTNLNSTTCRIEVRRGTELQGIHVKDGSHGDHTPLLWRPGDGNFFRFTPPFPSDPSLNSLNSLEVLIGDEWKAIHIESQSDDDNTPLILHRGFSNFFTIQKTNEVSNSNIDNIRQAREAKSLEISQVEKEIKSLKAVLTATPADKAAWDARLAQVIALITALQTELNTLNTDFLNAVKNTQVKPQTMPQVTKDGKGLVTQAALLGFVQPASRLNALATCEGNVQLSYLDRDGRMRQTHYDATADGNNAAFEQWIPDAQRACLNFSNGNSLITVNPALYLPEDWSIEAWFVHPLPAAGEWNTLIRGKDTDHLIKVRNRSQLGIYLNQDPLGQGFYDSGFNMDSLSEGWHHLAAVGRGDTTLFYIDGKKVGDLKAKACKDAAEALTKNPKDAVAKQRLEALKGAILKSRSNVYAIGNYQGGGQPFGKVAEVRIWGVALSDEEIAVNSTLTLSGNEPGLIAYYPMDEATGVEVRDHSGNGHNATVAGASWWGCTAAIGKIGSRTGLNFSNGNSLITVNPALPLPEDWSIEAWFVHPLPVAGEWGNSGVSWNTLIRGRDTDHLIKVRNRSQLGIYLNQDPLGQGFYDSGFNMNSLSEGWHHVAAVGRGDTTLFYIDGKKVGDLKAKACKDAAEALTKNPKDAVAKQRLEALKGAILKSRSNVYAIGNYQGGGQPFGKVAEVRIWGVALSDEQVAINSTRTLSGNEPGLIAYYPMDEATGVEVRDHSGNGHNTTVAGASWCDCPVALGKGDAVVCAEYSTVTLSSFSQAKVAMMRRFFAYPATNGVTLLPDQRIETLELKWIGNAQFAPTLLGYMEGPPPVPSENLTLSDDYNGATSVELTMSEDVEFNWNRSQDAGLGASVDTFIGAGGTMSILTAPMGMGTAIDTSAKVGFKGNFDFSYQFQNESSITSSSSLSMTDKLELRGTPEETVKFPHLGTRFIPKNIGYALVVSALADVFVTRLARSGKMVGYQVQPVDGIPPDVNTITFLMNPAYTMNGSLDGMTGSSATSDRFFKHVPEMRSQYGSLYPASYYRLKEAYDLKRQIEAEDKRRESYFSNFDVRTVDETSLGRNIDSGEAATTVGVKREEDKPDPKMTDDEKKKAQDKKFDEFADNAAADADRTSAAATAKRAEIQSKVRDQEKQVHATESFAGWQRRMESIQIRSGKSNIVNTYVWDADGGLRTEAQSFANTVEHSIGGSFAMNAGVGVDSEFAVKVVDVELTAQATVNLTQTMSKTEARSKGFELTVDLSGLEYKGITNYNDNPIMPGEKVDRYRFMSFYLEGSTSHFQDFFNYVVDPEWLLSNDEEARALRQVQAGKPNKAWRVLHRVTYVERPALMGFGRDLRKLRSAAEVSESQKLLDKISELEKKNSKFEEKLDAIISLLKERH